MPKTPATKAVPDEPAQFTAVPMTKIEVAKALAEMCATAGWKHVFMPTLKRRRDVMLKAVLQADDLTKNFAAELAGIKILDAIVGTQSKNEELLNFLRKLSEEASG